MLVCDTRWVLMHELHGAPEPSLEEQVARLTPCDLVLVEGFKYTPIPKLEVHRPANGKPFIWPQNPDIVAVASDVPLDVSLPRLDLNDREGIAAFILEQVGL
jgi:molybdopterin-guanine dinucleotide biosynthesis protein B